MNMRLLLGLICLGSLVVLASGGACFEACLEYAKARLERMGSMSARAEPSPYLERDNPLRTLLPSATAISARERVQHEQAVARALGRLQHVRHAEALITQPDPSAAPLDRPPPEYEVQVQLALSGPGPSELEVERVVRSVLPALAPGQLHIVARVPAPTSVVAPALTRVGPFMVARESSATLRATLAACLSANALLALILLRRYRRRDA